MFWLIQGVLEIDRPHGGHRVSAATRRVNLADQRNCRATLSTVSKLPHSVTTAALGVSLVFSALLTATALRMPNDHWLAWISLLPLFVVVRSLRPLAALAAGGFWGGCLYVFLTIGAPSSVATEALAFVPSAWLFVLMIVIPAVYVGLAARPARAVGFSLLTLALGWTLIEVVLYVHNPSGPHDVLLSGSQGEGAQLHWLARLVGYVCTAFLAGCANASLVTIVSDARLRFPRCRSLGGSPNAVGWVPSQAVPAIQSWILRQAHPRAPPA